MTCDKNLVNRLKRLEGQIKAVIRASEEEILDCHALVTQLKAIKGASEKAIAYITTSNLKSALKNNTEIDEALLLIEKNIG